ncbi:MAG: SRPBCC family protein [Azonexus sp.]|jgi:uncharacterized protein YndB with AHSA1/START domain|nr:SRPBCC family protein [Azonexus sp.]
MLHTISISHDYAAAPAIIWDILQDFGHIERWWPTDDPAVQIERVDVVGKGFGMIRHIYNKGYPDPVSERLEFLDPETLTWRLNMVGNSPMEITYYQATGRLEALPGGHCRQHYRSEFLTKTGKPDEAEAWLRMAYVLMFKGIAAAAAAGR